MLSCLIGPDAAQRLPDNMSSRYSSINQQKGRISKKGCLAATVILAVCVFATSVLVRSAPLPHQNGVQIKTPIRTVPSSVRRRASADSPPVSGEFRNHGVVEQPALTIACYNVLTKDNLISHSIWPHLAEPYRTTTLEAYFSGETQASVEFEWLLDGNLLTGQAVTHTFKQLGPQDVVVTVMNNQSGQVMTQAVYPVMVKYVRREIRSLGDDDRTAFLDALETVYRIPTLQGQALYGSEYKGIEYFVSKHLDGAGQLECDHWHDDAGIMTHHVGFTLEFEQALQVVNPAVSIPYWEYSLDAETLDDQAKSPIFQDEWFGEMSPLNDHHMVIRGRWAYTPVAQNSWDEIHNPYGLLRSPWNTDPTPYFTRHRLVAGTSQVTTPACDSLQTCFNHETLADLNACLGGITHGPVHIEIGGEWGHPDLKFLQKWNIDTAVVLIHKALWRRGYARVPTSCVGVAAADCKPSCPAEIMTRYNLTAYDVLKDSQYFLWTAPRSRGILYYDDEMGLYRIKGLEEDLDTTTKLFEQMLQALCNPGYVGEMFTSAAPYDPTFWLLHPSADRFLAYRRLVAEEENTRLPLDETWGFNHKYDDVVTTVGDMGVVCNWEGVGEMELPKCIEQTCLGHGEDDVLPFELKFNGKILPPMSNIQFYNWMHPDNAELPYMYDNYDWEWCVASGNGFGGADLV